MRITEIVIDVSTKAPGKFIALTEFQGFKSYAVRTVISGWYAIVRNKGEATKDGVDARHLGMEFADRATIGTSHSIRSPA